MSIELAPDAAGLGTAALNPRFPLLDSMRAVGALAVLTTHVAFDAGAYTTHGVLGALLSRLDVGVAIFFVLSGFLLSRPYLARAQAGLNLPATGRYLWKRLLRIAPVYQIVAVVSLVAIRKNAGTSPRDWLLTLTLTNTYANNKLPYGLTQMWSLAVEVAFYVVLPLLMLLAVGRRRRLVPGRVIVLLVVMTGVTVWWHAAAAGGALSSLPGAPLQWLPAYLSWFAIGIGFALADVLIRHGGRHPWARALVAAGRQPGSCWAAAGGLLLLCTTSLAGPTLLIPPTAAQSLFKSVLYALIGALLMLPAVFPPDRGFFVSAMSHRVARRLGLISYSLFATHLVVLTFVMRVTGWKLFDGHLVGIWLITTALSLIASEAFYRLVEVPAMRLKNLGRPVPAAIATPVRGNSISN